ncbi:hypothetical protein [Streptomyces sp. NPDC003487]
MGELLDRADIDVFVNITLPTVHAGLGRADGSAAIDEGAIGEPVGPTAFVAHNRTETWPHDCTFLFQQTAVRQLPHFTRTRESESRLSTHVAGRCWTTARHAAPYGGQIVSGMR